MRFSLAITCLFCLAACGSSGETSDAGTDIQAKALLGQACEQNTDCEQGWCEENEQGDYCSKSCSSDGDCESQTDDDSPLCCVSSFEQESFCEKIIAGGQCGDHSGSCGESCTGGLNSMCGSDYSCCASSPSDPKAICSMPCETDQDCDSCTGDCIVCMPISGGSRLCLQCLTR